MRTGAGRDFDQVLRDAALANPRSARAPSWRIECRREGRVMLAAVGGVWRRSVAVRLAWPGGPATETAAGAGSHGLAMDALARSAGADGEGSLAERLEATGVTITAGVSGCASFLDLRGPREVIHSGIAAAAQAFAAAAISPSAAEAARQTALHSIERRAHDIRSAAEDALLTTRFRPGSALARPPEGTIEAVSRWPVNRLAQTLRTIAASDLQVVIAGDEPGDEYFADLAPLSAATAGQVAAGPVPEPVPSGRQTELATGAAGRHQRGSGLRGQGYLLWGTAIISDDLLDHVVMEVGAHILGGWAGSRWNTLFREQLGATYGTHSLTTSGQLAGWRYCVARTGMAVAPGMLESAGTRMLADAEEFGAAGPGPAELMAAQVQLLRAEAHFFDSTRNLLARAGSFLQAGLDPAFPASRMMALRALDHAEFATRWRRLAGEPSLIELVPEGRTID